MDEGGALRAHKQRMKAEAMARYHAETRALNEAAVKRAAEREAAAAHARAVSRNRSLQLSPSRHMGLCLAPN